MNQLTRVRSPRSAEPERNHTAITIATNPIAAASDVNFLSKYRQLSASASRYVM